MIYKQNKSVFSVIQIKKIKLIKEFLWQYENRKQ